jgi:hypothetical protein
MRNSNTVEFESGQIKIVPDRALSDILGRPDKFMVIAFNDITITHMHA